MDFILRPENYKKWLEPTTDKILKTISSCSTTLHLEGAQRMIDNFILITALEDIESETIEEVINLFWIRLKLQETLINK